MNAVEETQQIIDQSDLRKWRIELPNLYDDSDLDPYEFRLLVHYKRVGTCTQSTSTTSKKTHMSAGQVSEKRQSLHDKGFIVMETVYLDEEKKTYSYRITVVDRWEENFLKYSTRSRGEGNPSQSESRLHGVKQRKNPPKKVTKPKKVKEAATPQPPEIVIFREVVNHYPKQSQRELVIGAIQTIKARLQRDVTVSDLQPFVTAWAKVSGNEWSLVWLLDWAVPGAIPTNGKVNNANNNQPAQKREYTADELERARQINAARRQSVSL